MPIRSGRQFSHAWLAWPDQLPGKPGADEKVSEAAMRLFRSGARMQRLLDDLVEFNRSNLGLGIPVDSKSAAGLI